VRRILTPKLGVRLLSVWALILAILPLANLLLLTQAVELYSNQFGNQGRVWIIFIMQTGFGLAFAASTYGLWQQHNWGRLLFLWTSVIWFGFNLLALIIPTALSPASIQKPLVEPLINGTRFAVALFIPLWYLNRPQVKTLFKTDTPKD